MTCAACGNDLKLDNVVQLNLQAYGGVRLAKALCCGALVYASLRSHVVVEKYEGPRTEDDWGFLATESAPLNVVKKVDRNPLANVDAARSECQRVFEERIQGLGVKPGALTIHVNGLYYVNGHVDWMWKQFKKDWEQ